MPTLQSPLAAHLDAIAPGWQPLVRDFIASEQGTSLQHFLDQRITDGAVIYPPRPFHALELTPPDATRVVILGQDPYHGAGQAHGLAFSVPEGVRVPPSLRNIFVELNASLGCAPAAHGNLERWARQGVLLLNAVLSVEDGQPASHAGRGWERLTDQLIAAVARAPRPTVFLLWGAYAQAKRDAITALGGPHLVLTANHPSPLSARRPPAPFIGCGHFARANAFLREAGRGTIDWCA